MVALHVAADGELAERDEADLVKVLPMSPVCFVTYEDGRTGSVFFRT